MMIRRLSVLLAFAVTLAAAPSALGVGGLPRTTGGGSFLFGGAIPMQFSFATVDAENRRAWIGGVLTKVSSTDPEVGLFAGDDAWFRVLDSTDGDRSTAMGFAGFESSEAYCAIQIWPDNNERTHPVTEGQIKVAT